MGQHTKGRVSEFILDPRRLAYHVGKFYKGEIEPIRRAVARRAKTKKKPVYVYIHMPFVPVKVSISTDPLEPEPGLDLVGVYDESVTGPMLRDDLPFSSVRAKP